MIKRAVMYTKVSSDDYNKRGLNLSGLLELRRSFALNKGFTFSETMLIIKHNSQGIIQ